uniref:Uncharacterized protein n=1 Tax=Anguilla anguilla TaxID=7936 RepID=A0A0E9Q4X9_ANGAN
MFSVLLVMLITIYSLLSV